MTIVWNVLTMDNELLESFDTFEEALDFVSESLFDCLNAFESEKQAFLKDVEAKGRPYRWEWKLGYFQNWVSQVMKRPKDCAPFGHLKIRKNFHA